MFCWIPVQPGNMKMERSLRWLCYHWISCWSPQTMDLGLNLLCFCIPHTIKKGCFKKFKGKVSVMTDCIWPIKPIIIWPVKSLANLSLFWRWTEGTDVHTSPGLHGRGRMHREPRRPSCCRWPSTATRPLLPEGCAPWCHPWKALKANTDSEWLSECRAGLGTRPGVSATTSCPSFGVSWLLPAAPTS